MTTENSPEQPPQPETTQSTDAQPEAAETAGTAVPPPAPRPVPTPKPGPGAVARAVKAPAAPPRPAPPAAAPGVTAEDVAAGRSEAATWGRVTEDGTVFVRTSDGEREVGQYAADSPDAALAFYVRRFEALEGQVELLEQRLRTGNVKPDEASKTASRLREDIDGAAAVGDLDGLLARVGAMDELVAAAREQRKVEREKARAVALKNKEKIVAAAEKVAEGSDWRNGMNRLRDLLTQWKAEARLDKASDDALWQRFSAARTAFGKKRKAHFAAMDAKRGEAAVVKRRLVAEAEKLKGSTEWGPTSGRFRDLMRDWKAAGPAPRDVEDQLWNDFRAAQDHFFAARDEMNAELDKEYAGNAEVKEKLLVEAEALLPVKDLAAAKASLREIGERWDAAGKVPRARVKELEGRMGAVEKAIRDADDARWKKSNPEAAARAQATVTQLESLIADLESKKAKAEAAGNTKAAADAAEAIQARQLWLAEAQKALNDYS